jgi:hypothetical protein
MSQPGKNEKIRAIHQQFIVNKYINTTVHLSTSCSKQTTYLNITKIMEQLQ